jgi:hypothetical protein
VVLLEGSGRWHYLNRQQGEEIGGVWYSNRYSIEKVYSGFGKGRAASRTAAWDAWDDDANYYGGRYYQGATRNDSGKLLNDETKRMDTAYAATVGRGGDDGLTWALQLVRVDGKEDEQVFWKKGYTGWLRMARNTSTRGFYRAFQQAGEAAGVDMCAILPANCIKFRPKNEKAWERGDLHTWTMEGGDHVPVPITVMSNTSQPLLPAIEHKTTAAGALLDLRDVARECGVKVNTLCLETNQPCIAGCETRCTKGAGEVSQSATFQKPENAADDAPTILATLAAGEEDQDPDGAYLDQLFSEANMREMSEQEMLEACEDYPEEAALALGRAMNCRWAWVDDRAIA